MLFDVFPLIMALFCINVCTECSIRFRIEVGRSPFAGGTIVSVSLCRSNEIDLPRWDLDDYQIQKNATWYTSSDLQSSFKLIYL